MSETYCRHRADNGGHPCAYCQDKHDEREWIVTFASDPQARWREHKRMKNEIESLKAERNPIKHIAEPIVVPTKCWCWECPSCNNVMIMNITGLAATGAKKLAFTCDECGKQSDVELPE